MAPIYVHIIGGGPGSSWSARDQVRADLVNTEAVDLDPANLLELGLNRYTPKPTAIGSTIFSTSQVLVGFRGSLTLLGDGDGAGDPVFKHQDWQSVNPEARWNQLVKISDTQAVYFVYGIGGSEFPPLPNPAGGSSSAYFKAYEVTIGSGSFAVGPEIILNGLTYLGNAVPAGGIIGNKHTIEYIGGGFFAASIEPGSPTSGADTVLQIFSLTEAGPALSSLDVIGIESEWSIRILYDQLNNGFHYISRSLPGVDLFRIGFAQRSGLGVTYSGHNYTTLGALTTPRWAELDPLNNIVIAGRAFSTPGKAVVMSYDSGSGYAIVDSSQSVNIGGEDSTFDFGVFNPPFDGNGAAAGHGGNNCKLLLGMGAFAGSEDFIHANFDSSVMDSKSFRVDSLGVGTIGPTIIESAQFTTDHSAQPNAQHKECLRASQDYARRNTSTIYAFYSYTNGSGLAKIKVAILRK